MAEKYVRLVQDMYANCETAVRCAVGVTEKFKVEVGLHQGSVVFHYYSTSSEWAESSKRGCMKLL